MYPVLTSESYRLDLGTRVVVAFVEGLSLLRNRAMVGHLWDYCLRVTEVTSLLEENVDLESKEIKVMGKGQKACSPALVVEREATPPLSAERAFEWRITKIFRGDDGQPVSAHALQQVLQRIGRKLGIRCNPHTFRHTGPWAW